MCMRNQFSFTAEEIKLLRLALDGRSDARRIRDLLGVSFTLLERPSGYRLRDRSGNRADPIIIEAKPAYRSYRDEIGDTLMPFGKYQGAHLRLLPEDYLQFLIKNHRAGRMKKQNRNLARTQISSY